MSPARGRPKAGSLPLGGTGAQRQGGCMSPARGRPKAGSLPLGGTGAQRQGG
jgi:hypothetical protein